MNLSDFKFKIGEARRIALCIVTSLEYGDMPNNLCHELACILDGVLNEIDSNRKDHESMVQQVEELKKKMEGKIPPPYPITNLPKCPACGKLNGHQTFEVCPAQYIPEWTTL